MKKRIIAFALTASMLLPALFLSAFAEGGALPDGFRQPSALVSGEDSTRRGVSLFNASAICFALDGVDTEMLGFTDRHVGGDGFTVHLDTSDPFTWINDTWDKTADNGTTSVRASVTEHADPEETPANQPSDGGPVFTFEKDGYDYNYTLDLTLSEVRFGSVMLNMHVKGSEKVTWRKYDGDGNTTDSGSEEYRYDTDLSPEVRIVGNDENDVRFTLALNDEAHPGIYLYVDFRILGMRPRDASAGVTGQAESTPGEDAGVEVGTDIVEGRGAPAAVGAAIALGALAAGAAVAGAAAASGKGGDGKDKKRKTYRMYVQKDFGDALRRGAEKPSVVRARMAEIDPSGAERDRGDLTAKIGVSGDGVTIHGAALVGRYCEATVSVPESTEKDDVSVTFVFEGEGGTFSNTVVFRVVGGPSIRFVDETAPGSGRFRIYSENCGIDAIPGDGFEYPNLFMTVDATKPPELSDITAERVDGFDVTFEKTKYQNVYKMIVKNKTPREKNDDVFAKVEERKFEIRARIEGEKEPIRGYVTVCLYPEGLTVQSRDEGVKNGVRYVRVQSYEKEEAGGLDSKWQVSEMKLTLAVLGEDKALIDPKGTEYAFDKLKGAGGKGTRADKEQSLAEKYEFRESHGMKNDKYTYVFEPNTTLCEPEDGSFFVTLLPVECTYNGEKYPAEIPLRMCGKPFDPLESWDEEFRKLRERVEKYSLPGDRDRWLEKLEEVSRVPRPATTHLRLMSKYVIRQYMRYWTIESVKFRNDAELYDKIVSQLEWVKFVGDCAFSYLVSMYAGALAEAIISPTKDYITESLGELIACWNYGTEIRLENFSISKTLEAMGDNVASGAISYENWKKAAETLGAYFVWSAIKKIISEAKEKGDQIDVWTVLVSAFSDMTVQGLKSAVGALFEKWIKNNKKVQKWIGEHITKHLNKYAGKGRTFNLKDQKITNMQYDLNDSLKLEGKLRELAGWKGEGKVKITKLDFMIKIVTDFFGNKAAEVKEFVDKTKFRQPGFFVNEEGHPSFSLTLSDEENGEYYVTVDLIYALANTASGYFNLLWGDLFGQVPCAPSAIEVPKDPPLPPAKEE